MFFKNSSQPLLSDSPKASTPATFVAPRAASNPLFEETSLRAIKLAHRRKWTTVGTVLVLACSGVALLAYSKFSENADRKIAGSFLAIETEYAAELQKYQTQMQTLGDKAPVDLLPDHQVSMGKFAEFAKAHPNDPLAWQGALRAASFYVERRQPEEARTLLEGVARKTLKNAFIQTRVRRTLAGIYAEAGDTDKALAEIDFIEKLPENPIPAETKLFKARLLYAAGKKDAAATLLRELTANPEINADPSNRSVSVEASLWLGFWGL